MRRPSPGAALAVVVVLAAAAYGAYGGEYSVAQLAELRARRETVRRDIVASRAVVDSLRLTERRLENDPATIERVARERFGMVREGEVLYRFVEVPPAAEGGRRIARTP